ncbi:unnamed protein product [Protopolystoma xenopodis]|uniref:Uncharacterized protein n=1 Tax=Protopolystoma xenopodis TaxID=117903 RepID=A0A3S5CRU4_9PLAT|nr:unnamed protein product [Protopolystoma xenopodis]
MYRIRDKWEDAYRVASLCSEHPNELRRQVAYLWARHLCSGSGGGESAVRLLNRLGQLDSSIELAVDACAFEFAFDLARQMAGPTATASSTATLPAGLGPVQDKRLAEVHYKHAMYLEDEGKFSEAEAEFVKVRFVSG